MVADSGGALDPDWDRENKNKLGLYIVKLMICEQLGGSFRLERCGGTTVAKVSFLLGNAEEKA